MATLHDAPINDPGVLPPVESAGLTAFIDRWIYVFTAGLIFVVVLVGFIPDSMRMLNEIDAGRAAPIPPILHVHAVLMGAWITLLLSQATLMATGRRDLHMRFGVAAFVLAPAILIAGFLLVPTRRGQLVDMIAAAPPEIALRLQTEVVPFVNNIMLVQIRAGIVFAILAALALYFRRRDSGTHKRLMFLATIVPLPAAIDRMTFLPHSMPASPLTIELYPLLVIAPLFAWDWFRLGRIHRAYVIWFAVMAPLIVAVAWLWNTPGWQEAAGRIGGLG